MQDPDYHKAKSSLRKFLDEESSSLLPTLNFYIQCAGLSANRVDAQDVAQDLLNDVAVEVLANAERFRPDAQPRAWILGIAANLIKRRQTRRSKMIKREPLIQDLLPHSEANLSEDEIFDQFAEWSQVDPGQQLETEETIDALLADLSRDDQQILKLAIVHSLDGKSLARSLGITPGAARVRLHRALNRAREVQKVEKTREFHG
jgi:RNA polymerase sigma-70 factor (ECF subfamily)